MRLLFVLAAIVAVIHLVRRPDARADAVGALRAGGVLAGFVVPDFGTLQRQVLVGARRQRSVAVNRTTRLPSEFLVTFASGDRAVVEPVEEAFFADVGDVLATEAAAKGWVLERAPRFTANYDDGARPGFPTVEATTTHHRVAGPLRTSAPGRERPEMPAPRRSAPLDAPVSDDRTRPYAEPERTSRPEPTTSPTLHLTDGAGRVVTLDRARDRLVIGRAPRSDLLVDDPAVSGRHARLLRGGVGWTIVDCGSTNGTFVNDRAAAVPTPLSPGDVVRLGPTVSFRVSA